MVGLASALIGILAQDPAFFEYEVGGTLGKPIARVHMIQDRVEPPKLSPAKFGEPPQQWMFEWLTTVLVDRKGSRTEYNARFLIYNQERKAKGDQAVPVGRMLSRLWDFNYQEMRLDHANAYNGGLIEVYLCWGGKAGGEHRYDFDLQYRNGRKVNNIYFFDLRSFTDPVEKAREVAHEYGHASLPPVGGFTDPEPWANGYLGERLYLRHLRDAMREGKIPAADVMDVSLESLDEWVKANVDPLVKQAARSGPDSKRLIDRSKAGMDAYIGLAMYIDTIFPRQVLSRSMVLSSQKAVDYIAGIESAAEEPEQITLRIPPYLKGEDLWVPLGKGQVFGAKVVSRNGNWAKLRPNGAAPVVLVPKRPPEG